MEKDYLQEALHTFNGGNWYGWKKTDDSGNVIPNDQRMKYEHIILNDNTAILPSKAEVDAKIQELKGKGSKGYVTKRKAAYPQIGDQLDMLWHSIDQNAELKQKYFAFYEAIKAVKAKYPK